MGRHAQERHPQQMLRDLRRIRGNNPRIPARRGAQKVGRVLQFGHRQFSYYFTQGFSAPGVSRVYPQKRRILRGWRRGGRIAIKAHEIASQNSFSIRFSQNFAYARVLSGVQIMISHANLGAANARADAEPWGRFSATGSFPIRDVRGNRRRAISDRRESNPKPSFRNNNFQSHETASHTAHRRTRDGNNRTLHDVGSAKGISQRTLPSYNSLFRTGAGVRKVVEYAVYLSEMYVRKLPQKYLYQQMYRLIRWPWVSGSYTL